MTQIHHIKADAEKHRQEVLTMTNMISDTIEKNNIIISEKWEVTHKCIDPAVVTTIYIKYVGMVSSLDIWMVGTRVNKLLT